MELPKITTISVGKNHPAHQLHENIPLNRLCLNREKF